MKPYLVHKTWIDLDHVVAIPTTVEIYDSRPMYGGDFTPGATVDVQCLFRSKPVTIHLGDVTDNELAKLDPMRAQNVLDDLIAAWKAKDLRDWVAAGGGLGGGGGGPYEVKVGNGIAGEPEDKRWPNAGSGGWPTPGEKT